MKVRPESFTDLSLFMTLSLNNSFYLIQAFPNLIQHKFDKGLIIPKGILSRVTIQKYTWFLMSYQNLYSKDKSQGTSRILSV